MNYTQQQFDKLPKWAKDRITILEADKKSLEKRISEILGESETNVNIRLGLDKIPLPNNSQIEFLTGERKENKVDVYIMNDGAINVNTDSRSGKTMVIIPRAANSFYIDFV